MKTTNTRWITESMRKSIRPSIGAAVRSLPRTLLVATVIGGALVQTACFPLAVTGVAVGTMALVDRRTVGSQTDDQAIELKSFAKISEQVAKNGGITVTSYNRRVLISGQVLTAEDKQKVEKAMASVEQVVLVHNELNVSGRASLGVNASDTVITNKVKAAFIDAKDVQTNTTKVVTEQGVVYLMGLLTSAEANRAAQVASRVGGVQKVVTLVELISEDEVKRINRK